MRIRAELEPQPVPVVLIDHAGGDVAAVDGGDDRLVVLVDLGVALEPGEPPGGRRLAVLRDDGADDRREVGVGRGDRDLALPLRLREVEQRARQLRRAAASAGL